MNKSIVEIFTQDEIKRAAEIIADMPITPHRRIVDEIVTPAVMERIDRETGQENNTAYVAYLLEFAATKLPFHIQA